MPPALATAHRLRRAWRFYHPHQRHRDHL